MQKETSLAWSQNTEETLVTLDSFIEGLSAGEASDRLNKFGKNIFSEKKGLSVFALLLRQFTSPLIIILIIATISSFVLNKYHEAYFVLTAVIVNVMLGYWQEFKANNAIKKLDSYITQKARVRRDNKEISINAQDVVIGDIVIMKTGSLVPADLRILEENNLEIDEALLTGESLAQKKTTSTLPETTALGDRTNMAWGGSVIADGDGLGVVIATGRETALGKIATLVSNEENEKTPLERSVGKLAITITVFLVVVASAIFAIGVANGYVVTDIFFITLAVIVSAVPEGLPIAMSVVLAMGASTLAKKNGVVRKMSATETLGATSLILTDKTGTLTEGRLSLEDVTVLNKDVTRILTLATANTDVVRDPKTGKFIGKPVEVSLAEITETHPEVKSSLTDLQISKKIAFNSHDKFSSIQYIDSNGEFISLLGAPEILISQCDLTEKEERNIHELIAQFAESGERVLGVAEKNIDDNKFTFLGLIRFRDPIRATVRDSVERIVKAGVRVKIVTGDHPGTGAWAGREIGILKDDFGILTGVEIDLKSDEELLKLIPKIAVFARTTPEQKLRLVELFSKLGEIVAVTGDGINDAPALKRASIGVAMGSGTDVARTSSDLIILDDNFETIVEAIFVGRGVLHKMRTVITYLLADSFDELLLVGGALVAGLVLPITALQILFVKFFSDIFPAMAFTFEKIDSSRTAHRRPKLKIFDNHVKIFTLARGFVSSSILLVLYIYLIKIGIDQELAQSFIFASFASYMLFLAFSMRNLEESIFKYKIFSNHYLTLGVGIGFAMILLALYYPPLSSLLGATALPPLWLIGVLGIGILNLFIMEALKWIVNLYSRKALI
jgi:Ca2+-transporting ATPase